MAEWKPFDLTWGRSIYYCTECKEGIEVPTSCGKPMYKFCPMCGARMDTADTPQTEEKHAICNGCVYCDLPNAFHPCASCVDFSKYVGEESGDTPQTDCAWMYDSRRDYEYDKALDEMERNFVEFEEYDDGEDKSEEVTE